MLTAHDLTFPINYFLNEPESTLLNGITFGTTIPRGLILYNEMKRIGISHIAVFSGANISIVLSSFSFIRGYIGNKLYILLAILFILFVGYIVGVKAPVVRAALFSLFTYVGILLKRRRSAIYLVIISAFLILSLKPYWISSVSFQLSFAATLSILVFIKYKSSTDDNPIISYLKDELRVSTAALIGTAPIIFYYFKQISLIAPISNILISFIIPPILILGLVAGLVGNISIQLARLPLFLAHPLLSYIIIVSDFLSRIPFACLYF